MGLNNSLHNVPVRIEPGQASLAPPPFNNNNNSDRWCKIKKSLSTALNDVEVCLLRLNTSSNTICIGLPDLRNKVKAESKITKLNLGAMGLTLCTQKKICPN